jgi:hypothetical protein
VKTALLVGVGAVAIAAASAIAGWFAHERYGDTWPDYYQRFDPSTVIEGVTPEAKPDGTDTRPTEDLPKCAELDPKYLAWLDTNHVMRPRCQP